ncbi:MAG: elongation factor 4 [Calditrichales bacterium]|nr:MAG: elongation factor 4 [Calditrichales bacterium]
MYTDNIRNFCIIAHIDHGKSTLADRMLELTKTISSRDLVNQVLDNMELERERGITIKSHAIQMRYVAKNNQQYTLNLIDTPGHVDFSYEVFRSLAACEGALLVVDAAQGIEAQTLSNLYLAIENDLQLIPVINKIDLPGAQVESVKNQIIQVLGCSEDEIHMVSAKSGVGVAEVLEAVIKTIPPPKGSPDNPAQALVFDSVFDSYRGVITFIRVFEGRFLLNDAIKFFFSKKHFEVGEIGILKLTREPVASLQAGEVGYLISGAKDVHETKVGDTITTVKNPASTPLFKYKEIHPMVYSGIYPIDSDDFEQLRESLDKLYLNDSSLVFVPETSKALGFGFRCGFLGLLHMEIIQERLEREYKISIINTLPNVVYRVVQNNGVVLEIDNPTNLPSPGKIDFIEEPYINAQIITPTEYIGNIMKLARERRGTFINTEYLDTTRVDMNFKFPLAEVIFDFFDKLKSISRGYASFDYVLDGFQRSNLVKIDILINAEIVDALSMITHNDKAYEWGNRLCRKLKDLIPRQMFEVAIQAAIGSKVISRTNVKALRKNVLAKCYGGDITRKRKLLEKQKEGKKRMKKLGSVEIPQEAFLAVLSMDSDK